MKTTVEIRDDLLAQARRRATREGTTLRDVLERGLQMLLKEPAIERSPEFHWRQFPDRLQRPLVPLDVNSLIDQIRDEADERAAGGLQAFPGNPR